ncbi:helix-turn-helix domain-containing protein [Candidatus Micrarchaeota archaeon]|jgi:predicted transcriptional regulator|nr:helix-turn-helix domain-containing protein [Candidatus Micrarchaeota archaeon]
MLPELKQLIISLKQKRKQLDLSQNELAKKSGVSQSLIAKLESNKVVPSYNAIQKIENTLEMILYEKEKKVADIMHSPILSVDAGDTAEKAAGIMKKHDYSQIPVKKNSEFVGSISERELISVNKNVKTLDIMGPLFDIVSWDTPISSIKAMFKDRNKKAILIRNKKGEIKGIVTTQDLI